MDTLLYVVLSSSYLLQCNALKYNFRPRFPLSPNLLLPVRFAKRKQSKGTESCESGRPRSTNTSSCDVSKSLLVIGWQCACATRESCNNVYMTLTCKQYIYTTRLPVRLYLSIRHASVIQVLTCSLFWLSGIVGWMSVYDVTKLGLNEKMKYMREWIELTDGFVSVLLHH